MKARSIHKNNDTSKDSTFFSARSTPVVQIEDGGHWMHGVIIEGNSSDPLRVILLSLGDEDGKSNCIKHEAH